MVEFENDGSVTFRVYMPHAQRVLLVGDFTGWQEGGVALDADGSGWWCRRGQRLGAGDYSFSYLVDDHFWVPDYAASGVRRNEFGNWTSVLVVPGSVTKRRVGAGRLAQPRLTRRAGEPAVVSTSAPSAPPRTRAAPLAR